MSDKANTENQVTADAQAADKAPAPVSADAKADTKPAAARDYEAELKAAHAQVEKATKQLKVYEAKSKSSEDVLSKLKAAFGGDQATVDPLAELQTLRAKTESMERTAKGALVRASVLGLAASPDFRAKYPEKVVRLLDLSDVEVDLSTGQVTDASVITDRLNALKAEIPELFVSEAADKGAPLPPQKKPAAPTAETRATPVTAGMRIQDFLKIPHKQHKEIANPQKSSRFN